MNHATSVRPNAATHRITVALSGGVDSAVAAWLLARQGYAVRGVFMKNWEDDDREGYCRSREDFIDALACAERMGIELDAVNFAADYRERVFAHFLAELRAGRTPNPDILCNRELKFKVFLTHALKCGADWIATGHYARSVYRNGRYELLRGFDVAKDQSYFLYTLGQRELARTMFPLGELRKVQVRAMAREAGLPVHAKPDSTGICFIGERPFRAFLSRYLRAQAGEIHTADGRPVGVHPGVSFFTLGQREGLNIGGVRGAKEAPWYVVGKDLDRNLLFVAQEREHPWLLSRALQANDLSWVAGAAPSRDYRCTAKTRYRQSDQACTLTAISGEHCRVAFDQVQWAVTPGQSVVFYRGDSCLGGGVIQSTQSTP